MNGREFDGMLDGRLGDERIYRAERRRVTSHKRYAHRMRSYGLFLYCSWSLQCFLAQRGKSMSAGLDDGGRAVSVHLIHSFLLFCCFPFVKTVICHTFDEWEFIVYGWGRCEKWRCSTKQR